MTTSLKRLREARGWTLERAAQELGLSRGGYIKLERGERRLTADRIAKISDIYRVDPSDVLRVQPEMILSGSVAPTGIVTFEPTEKARSVEGKMPPGGEDFKVLEIRDGAIPGIGDIGWHIFYSQFASGVPEERIGCIGVFSLRRDDTVLVGKAFHGMLPGTYDIQCSGMPARRHQEIVSSALVAWIRPN